MSLAVAIFGFDPPPRFGNDDGQGAVVGAARLEQEVAEEVDSDLAVRDDDVNEREHFCGAWSGQVGFAWEGREVSSA